MSENQPTPAIVEGTPLRAGWSEFRDSEDDEGYDAISGQMDAKRIFDGPWNDRQEFIYDVLTGVTSTSAGNQIYTGGLGYPDYPNAIACRATVKKLLATGIDSRGIIAHQKCRVTIYYDTQAFNNNGQDPDGGGLIFADETWESSTEMLTFPFNKTIPGWTSSSGAVFAPVVAQGSFKKLFALITYKIHFPIVLVPKWAAMDNALGCINKVALPGWQGPGRAIETLRYDGYTIQSKRVLRQGMLSFDIVHTFVFNKIGWNNSYDVVEDPLQLGRNPPVYILTVVPTNPTIYTTYDFLANPIFDNPAAVVPLP